MIDADSLKYLEGIAYDAALVAAVEGRDAVDAARQAVFKLIMLEEGILTGYAIATRIAEDFAPEAVAQLREAEEEAA